MSYRLITKATLTLDNNERMAEIRAYAAPKGAPVGTIEVNGVNRSFQLTGGQGRGTVVRCYMYFHIGTESGYIEITKDEMTTLKAGHTPRIVSLVATPEAPESVEEIEAAMGLAVEQAPKATRKSRKAVAA